MQLVLPVEALILDIGNVICDWNPVKLAQMSFPGSGEPDGNAMREVINVTVGHPDWLELDRGVLTRDAAIKNAQQRTSIDGRWIESLYRKMPESLTLLPDTSLAMELARDAGLPIYILSNMPSDAGDYLFNKHGCFTWIRHAVLSCDCNLLKPDPAIYHHLIDTCGLTPQHSIFLDDMAENVVAARECGLQSFQVVDTSSAGDMIRHIVETRSGDA